jgi:flagellar motor switch protein FliN/FliY
MRNAPSTSPGGLKTDHKLRQTEEEKMTEETETKGVAQVVNGGGIDSEKIRVLNNIEVEMSIEVGRSKITIRDLLRLNEGSVVELDRLAGEPLDILINGTMIAKGEVVMVGERFGIRLTDIVDPAERVQKI